MSEDPPGTSGARGTPSGDAPDPVVPGDNELAEPSPRTERIAPQFGPEASSVIRIVNLNTWIGCLPRTLLKVVGIEPPGHKDRRIAAMLHELRARSPDVITLQECLPLPGYARRIAAALDYDLLWRVGNSGMRVFGLGLPTGVGRGEGLAILAKKGLGLRQVGTKRLSGKGLVTNWCALQAGPLRWALAALVTVAGRPCIVVTTHVSYSFPSKESFRIGWAELHDRAVVKHREPPKWLVRMAKDNDEVRDKELQRLAHWLARLQDKHQAPVLVGADFNLDPETPQVGDFLATTGFINALPTLAPGMLTWDPGGNDNIAFDVDHRWPDGEDKPAFLQLMAWLDSIPQCPDHVMLSPGLTLTDAGRAFDHPVDGVLASDHYGIWADAVLAGPAR